MRIRDYYIMGFKNLFRNKKNTIANIVITTTTILLVMIVLTASDSIIRFIKENINKNMEFRTMFVKYDVMEESIEDVIKKLSTIQNVSRVVEQDKYQAYITIDEFKTPKTDGEIHIIASDNDLLPPIVIGRTPNNKDEKYIICPTKFIADGNLEERKDLTKNDYIEGKTFLNKQVTLSYKSYDYSSEIPKVLHEYNEAYTLIGLYNTYDNYAKDNVCYISFSNIASINEKSKGNVDEYTQEVFLHPIIIVNDSDNVDKVAEEVISMGYTPIKRMSIDKKLVSNIKGICIFTSILSLFIAFISMILYTVRILKKRENDIGLLKAIGYKNKEISFSLIIENIFMGIISLVISIIIYIILYYGLINITKTTSLMFLKMTIKFNWQGLLLSTFYILLIPIICNIIMFNKIKKINIINMIKG